MERRGARAHPLLPRGDGVEHLRDAVQAAGTAAQLARAAGTPSADYSANVIVALRDLFEQSRDPADLDTAFEAARAELRHQAGGSEEEATLLAQLAITYAVRHSVSHTRADLDEAVRLVERAVVQVPPGSEHHARHRTLLGDFLAVRHGVGGDPADLRRAIELSDSGAQDAADS